MEKAFIKLLQKRIDKLSNEDFDLDAWKSGTISVLERVFGEQDPRIRKIEDLKVDYSSWALRDATSKYNPVETCKKKGMEILQTFIEEIELLGVRDKREVSLIDTVPKEMQKSIKEAMESENWNSLEKSLKSSSKETLIRALVSIFQNRQKH